MPVLLLTVLADGTAPGESSGAPIADTFMLEGQCLIQGKSLMGRALANTVKEGQYPATAGIMVQANAQQFPDIPDILAKPAELPTVIVPGGLGTIDPEKNARTGHLPLRLRSLTAERISFAVCATLFCVSICCLAWAGPVDQFRWGDEDWHAEDKEVEVRDNVALDEDTYGLAVSVLVRDCTVVALGEGKSYLRNIRFFVTFLLVFVNMSLQVFLLFQVLHLVTPSVVINLRTYYDKFEWHMYGKNMSHFVLAADGTRRGLEQYFQPKLFESLDYKTKKEVCHVPFSQPAFFMVVLFIWALTCTAEFRRGTDMFRSLIMVTPTVATLEETLRPAVLDDPTKVNKKVVVGLTWRMKVFITWMIVLPRLGLTTVLLWLGSRWLAATNNFGDLIMNTVALEFILLLQYVLYKAVVPARNKRDCMNIEVLPTHREEPAGLMVFACSFLWLVLALTWTVLYTYYWQQVLPEYNWDVRDICAEWLFFH